MQLLAKNRVAARIVTSLYCYFVYFTKKKILDNKIRTCTFKYFAMIYYETQLSTLPQSVLYSYTSMKYKLMKISRKILTSIGNAIFAQNKCPLFFVINNCNLCWSTKIYLVNL